MQDTQQVAAVPEPAPPLAEQARGLAEEIRAGRATLANAVASQVDSREKLIRRKVRDHGRFERALKKVYTNTEHSPYFFENRTLIDGSLMTLLTFIDALTAHAVTPKPYFKDEIVEAFRVYQNKSDNEAKALAALENIIQKSGPLKYLRELLFLSSDIPAELEEALVRRGLVDEDIPPLKAIIAAKETISETRHEADFAAIELDIRMVRAVMQSVLDFKLVKKVHPFLLLTYPERAPDYYTDALLGRLFPDLKAQENSEGQAKEGSKRALLKPYISNIDPREDLSSFLTDQFPPIKLYSRTVQALAFYRGVLEKTETTPQPKITRNATHLRKGSRSPMVEKLRRRLMLEGFLPEEQLITPLFDSTLSDALRHYQTTHQIDINGIVDNLTRSSLNRSIKFRVRQLELGLQRYRESQINRDRPDLYLRVNIPEFSAELWKNGQIVRKHKIVVGNNNWEEDHRRKIVGYLNRTQIFEAVVTNIVVNPFWRVPKRIKTFELDEALLDNPDFYERNRYEVETSATGDETVRQMPGEANALGRVKINFLNPHAIFMHDTPQKPLFERVFRAFSHGCMRLHNPLDMARFILHEDQEITPERFQEILDSYEETSMGLKRPIPIYVEYNVTTVDEDGKPHFLADIYKYDNSYFSKELPAVNQFELEAFKEGEMVPFDGGAVKVRQP